MPYLRYPLYPIDYLAPALVYDPLVLRSPLVYSDLLPYYHYRHYYCSYYERRLRLEREIADKALELKLERLRRVDDALECCYRHYCCHCDLAY